MSARIDAQGVRRRGTHRATTTAAVAAVLLAVAGVAATARLTGPEPARAAALETLATTAPTGSATSIASSTQASWAYGWPVKPFFRQHPVRGFFGDPRIGMTPKGMRRSFHFGIDIACPNGTPVYANVTGDAYLESFRPETVSVIADDGHTVMQYWHIRPAVRHRQRVVAYRTIVGYVLAPWQHVHFSEMHDETYLNPLRPGALGPFVDHTRPIVTSLCLEHGGKVTTLARSTTVDLVVEAYDTTPIPVPGPWRGKPVTPAEFRWRLLDLRTHNIGRWSVAVDVRRVIPPDWRYDEVYGRWTRQNKKHRPGRYRFVLGTGIATAPLRAGTWVLQVEATDVRGNRTVRAFALPVATAKRDLASVR